MKVCVGDLAGHVGRTMGVAGETALSERRQLPAAFNVVEQLQRSRSRLVEPLGQDAVQPQRAIVGTTWSACPAAWWSCVVEASVSAVRLTLR